jgi:hypothetical protein
LNNDFSHAPENLFHRGADMLCSGPIVLVHMDKKTWDEDCVTALATRQATYRPTLLLADGFGPNEAIDLPFEARN